jgi:hypothetical protein
MKLYVSRYPIESQCDVLCLEKQFEMPEYSTIEIYLRYIQCMKIDIY